MWFTNANSTVTNRVFPVLQQNESGRSVTRWKHVDDESYCKHFYHLTDYAPTIPQRDRRLPRGGLKAMQSRRDAFVDKVKDEEGHPLYDAHEQMRDAFRDRDFELMGVYEKFITKDNKKEMLPIVNNCVSALRAMGRMDIEAELTEEHFKAHTMISHAVGEVSVHPMFDTIGAYFASSLLWVSFQDLSLAPKLAAFVRTTGITDMKVILKRLPEIRTSHASMMEGVL